MDTHLSKKIIKSRFADKQVVSEKKDAIYENNQRDIKSKPMVFDVSRGTWIFPEQGRSRCGPVENEEKANF